MSDTTSFPLPNTTDPQLTFRAIATGMLLGGVLSLCNIYSGLKIGWGFNMSITAMLLGFGFFRLVGGRPFGMLENNINQTAASAAASISSAGLVAPIPAMTILTGESLSWWVLTLWTLAVSLVGISVAIGLRKQMLVVERLPFPNGIASAETIKEMYGKGTEAMARLHMLLVGGAVAAVWKLAVHFAKIPKLAFPGSVKAVGGGTVSKYSLYNLGFALDPSPLMVAVGALIGVRAGLSMLLGAVVAWGFIGPAVLDAGWASTGPENAVWFGPMNKWMLWPGVAMMVTASLTSFAFSWRSIVSALTGGRRGKGESLHRTTDDVPGKVHLAILGVASALAVVCQVAFFGIQWWTAVLAVAFTFVLAIVAGRVAGETGVTPVGAMGKVTQLLFGVVSPGNATANLMAANVTGGAASQCADLLHDMKTGLLIGASPRQQAYGQIAGVFAGAAMGSLGYLILVPDPAAMLLTDEWPAPAVAAWKAVAEIFAEGLSAMPARAPEAMALAGALGIVLALCEKMLPRPQRTWVPSPSAVGLALVIPAYYAVSMCLGGLFGLGVKRVAPSWEKRFLIVLAAGVIAGESLSGVGLAIADAVQYLGGR